MTRFYLRRSDRWSKNRFSKQSAIIIAYTIFLLGLCISVSINGWLATWRFLGVPSVLPEFADMRTVQGAVASTQLGLDPQVENPGDPWGRKMNYPKLWVHLATQLNLYQEPLFLLWNYFVIAMFVSLMLYILVMSPTFGTLVTLVSGSTLLAVERGSNDLLILVLLAFSALSRGLTSPIVYMFAVILKLYPAVIIPLLNYSWRTKIALVASSLLYMGIIWDQLPAIFQGNTARGPQSYGLRNILFLAEDYLSTSIDSNTCIFIIYLTVLFFFVISLLVSDRFKFIDINPTNLRFRNLFKIGSLTYCATYLFSANHDYRLIFLILCLPWITSQKKALSLPITTLIIFSSNYLLLSLILPLPLALLVSTAAKFLLFLFLGICNWNLGFALPGRKNFRLI